MANSSGLALLREQNALAETALGNTCRFLQLRRHALKVIDANRGLQLRNVNDIRVSPQKQSTGRVSEWTEDFGRDHNLGEGSQHYTCPGCARRYPDKASLKVHESRCQKGKQRKAGTAEFRNRSHDEATLERIASVSPSRPSAQADTDMIVRPPGYVEPDFSAAMQTQGVPAYEPSTRPVHACPFCHRLFALDRIEKHKSACQEDPSKRRGVFQVQRHYQTGEGQAITVVSQTEPDGQSDARTKTKKSLWRQQSVQLQRAMRAARGATNDGLPEDVDTRVLCEGCGRKFAPDTAERHIPKCIEKNKRK
jgi:ribosomal protein L37AE/L43A